MGRYDRERVRGWTPFRRAVNPPITEALVQKVAIDLGTKDLAMVRRMLADIDNDVIWLNNRYQVNVRHIKADWEGWPDMIHLSIKRRDKERVGPERYRDFMRIKDEILSPEHEGVELYPARENEVDTANQYHIWCLAEPGRRFPFGWHTGPLILTAETAAARDGGSRQQPFDETDANHERATLTYDEQQARAEEDQ